MSLNGVRRTKTACSKLWFHVCVGAGKRIKVPVECFSGLLWYNAFGVTHLVPQRNRGKKCLTFHPIYPFKLIKQILLLGKVEISVKHLGLWRWVLLEEIVFRWGGWPHGLLLWISRAEGWNIYMVWIGCGENPHVMVWFLEITGKSRITGQGHFFIYFDHFTPVLSKTLWKSLFIVSDTTGVRREKRKCYLEIFGRCNCGQ